MVVRTLRQWLGGYPPVLAIQLVDQEVRYVVREGAHILIQGSCAVPHAIVNGRIEAPELLAQALLPKLPKFKGKVAVALPARWLHVHEMSLPVGLDNEERAYQIERYIIHHLGLALADVFYDWTLVDNAENPRVSLIQLAIARQTEVSPYYHVFAGSDWQMSWVCSEAQVWSLGYQNQLNMEPIAICQVESQGLSLWYVEKDGRVQSYYKQFDSHQISQAGFVYQAALNTESMLQLPVRFVAEELVNLLPVWLGDKFQNLTMLYVTGKAVDWETGKSVFQSRLGVPLHSAEDQVTLDRMGGGDLRCNQGLAILWYLSKLVNE